jgi:hypothetical protein
MFLIALLFSMVITSSSLNAVDDPDKITPALQIASSSGKVPWLTTEPQIILCLSLIDGEFTHKKKMLEKLSFDSAKKEKISLLLSKHIEKAQILSKNIVNDITNPPPVPFGYAQTVPFIKKSIEVMNTVFPRLNDTLEIKSIDQLIASLSAMPELEDTAKKS